MSLQGSMFCAELCNHADYLPDMDRAQSTAP
jgi:hypothetical protein